MTQAIVTAPAVESRDVSVLGLGHMGAALASALVRAGHHVTVWNRTSARAEPLLRLGATGANSLREAIEASSTVVLCAGDTATGRDLVEQAGDAVAGRTVISLTGGTPKDAIEMGRVLEQHGASLVEGMILVFPKAIGTSAARIIYAAPDEVFDTAREVVSAFGGSTLLVSNRLGSVSALGTAATGFFHLVFQAYALMAETARGWGVDFETSTAELVVLMDVLVEAMQTAPAALAGHVRTSDSSTVELGVNEMDFVVAVMKPLGVDLEQALAARAALDRAVARGYGSGPLGSVIHGLRAGGGAVSAAPTEVMG